MSLTALWNKATRHSRNNVLQEEGAKMPSEGTGLDWKDFGSPLFFLELIEPLSPLSLSAVYGYLVIYRSISNCWYTLCLGGNADGYKAKKGKPEATGGRRYEPI